MMLVRSLVALGEESPSIDLHSHPGMFPSSPLSMDAQVERMSRGKVRVSLFAAVADGPVIGRRSGGGLYAAREPRPGESPAYTYRSLGDVRAGITAGSLTMIQSPADVDATRASGRPGAILSVEGGDLLEGRIDRVQEAYATGVRLGRISRGVGVTPISLRLSSRGRERRLMVRLVSRTLGILRNA